MHKEYAVILCFNSEFSRKIEGLWNELGYDGLIPHITLGDYVDIDLDKFKEYFNTFFDNKKKIVLNFNTIGCFPQNKTIYIAPTIRTEFWKLHQIFQYAFEKFNHNSDSYYLPNRWVPHCTLISKVADEEFQSKFSYCVEHFSYEQAIIESVKLVEVKYKDSQIIEQNILLSKKFI